MRKLIEFDDEIMSALKLLASDTMTSLQELADEAFRDLLKKHGRPTSLKEALRESARKLPTKDHPQSHAKAVMAPKNGRSRQERRSLLKS